MSTRNSHHTPLTYLFSCKHSGTYSLNFPPSQCWLGYSNDGVSPVSPVFFFGVIRFPSYVDKKWYFVTKIVLTYCEKKSSSDREKPFCKIFEITRTIYSNIKRSEQFLVMECFFNLFLEVSHI